MLERRPCPATPPLDPSARRPPAGRRQGRHQRHPQRRHQRPRAGAIMGAAAGGHLGRRDAADGHHAQRGVRDAQARAHPRAPLRAVRRRGFARRCECLSTHVDQRDAAPCRASPQSPALPPACSCPVVGSAIYVRRATASRLTALDGTPACIADITPFVRFPATRASNDNTRELAVIDYMQCAPRRAGFGGCGRVWATARTVRHDCRRRERLQRIIECF
jgi:hypothetical protein